MQIKKVASIMLVFSIFLLSINYSVMANIPQHTGAFYVNDFANVLTPETSAHIVEKNLHLNEISGAQIVVSTVHFTDGISIEDYAMDMFNTWGIGDSVQNNGILLLLVIGQEDYYVAMGDGTNSFISAGEIDRILHNYLEPYFAIGEYDTGVFNTFNEIYSAMANVYNLEGNNATNNLQAASVVNTVAPVNTNNSSNNTSVMFYVFFIAMFVMLMPVVTSRRRRRRGIIRRRRRSSLFWWLMPSPLRRNRNNQNNTPTPPTPTYKGGNSGVGRGGSRLGGGGASSGGGIGRGGNRFGGGGRSSGGGVGRRK